MANNLATLNTALATALRDTTYKTWPTGQIDNLITWSVARLYPHLARRLDPTATTIALVADTYFYAAPAGVIEIEGLELYDTGTEWGFLNPQSWYTVGDAYTTLKVRISPIIVADHEGDTLRVHGYGRYDTTTNLIPDDFVLLVLAMARAEAYRQMGGDRAQFLQWQASEQEQNISANELLQLINEADIEAESLWRRYRTQRRPVPGRLSY